MKHNKVCLDQERISELIDLLVDRKAPNDIDKNPFLDRDEALAMLRCSPGTLQKLRDEDKIEFYSVSGKKILYSHISILNYVKSKSNRI